jgi:transcriptional regulator with XRE-family HTH domain
MGGKKDEDPLRVLGERLEQRRLSLGLGVQDLIPLSGLRSEQIEAVLAGRGAVDIGMVLKMAGALGVDSRDLFDGITWVPARDGGEYRVDNEDG